MSTDAPVTPLADALADVRIRAPTRGNRRLERLLDAVNADPQVKAWWHVGQRVGERGDRGVRAHGRPTLDDRLRIDRLSGVGHLQASGP